MLAIATTVWSVRATSSSIGATPGRTLWGGPSQAGGLATIALATPAAGRAGGSKKLIGACYGDGSLGEYLSCSCHRELGKLCWPEKAVLVEAERLGQGRSGRWQG